MSCEWSRGVRCARLYRRSFSKVMNYPHRRAPEWPHPAGALLGASAGWLVLAVSAPVLPATLASGVYLLGSLVCHQQPDRSFHWHGAQFAVCARCTGIYTGAMLAMLWVLLRYRPSSTAPESSHDPSAGAWLVLSAGPSAAMVVGEWLGFWSTSNLVRALAGLALGAGVALVAGRVATLHYQRWRWRRLV